jgi:hypothetical protein
MISFLYETNGIVTVMHKGSSFLDFLSTWFFFYCYTGGIKVILKDLNKREPMESSEADTFYHNHIYFIFSVFFPCIPCTPPFPKTTSLILFCSGSY